MSAETRVCPTCGSAVLPDLIKEAHAELIAKTWETYEAVKTAVHSLYLNGDPASLLANSGVPAGHEKALCDIVERLAPKAMKAIREYGYDRTWLMLFDG